MEPRWKAFKREVPREVVKVVESHEPATPEQIRMILAWANLLPKMWPTMRGYRVTQNWYQRNACTIREIVGNDRSIRIDALTIKEGANDESYSLPG